MIRRLACIALGLWALLVFSPLPAQERENRDDFPAKVRAAIDKGVHYLKSTQRNGNWEHIWQAPIPYAKNGTTCLALLAMLECGVPPDDRAIVDGLNYLRGFEPEFTYVTALQTMVFSRADPKRSQFLIKRNADWLKTNLIRDGNQVTGWGYGKGFRGGGTDHSNSQYALLGLHSASVAGVIIEDKVWKDVQQLYTGSQQRDGGWSYHPQQNRGTSITTMTAAGVCGLLIAGMQLYKDTEVIEKDGTIRNCGQFEINDPLSRGLKQLADSFTVDWRAARYYNLYGIERAGRLSGQRFFIGNTGKKHDWYQEGAHKLVGWQTAEGSWLNHSPLDGNTIISTSFALLFLSKGKTPVLIHKMIHGREPRGLSGDWNNDRNDVRNLTEFCSQKLFKRLPLTWQAFDAGQLDPGNPRSVAEMLQAPIMYFNGHLPPHFSGGEKHLLKEYVEQGGFIMAEACCGRKEFDQGFRELTRELWPDRKLEPLSPDHPIWSAFAAVPPGSIKLEGIDFGCKTCVVYSPQDLSCYWESNRFEGEGGLERAVLAFRAGGNIVAYATGLEPPQDKLTRIDVVNKSEDRIKRNFLHVAQINYGGRDWQPAPNAMRAVMDHLRKDWNVDVILQTKAITPADSNLFNYKFLYMHGRRKFNIPQDQQKLLRDHLQFGGVLLADACCGSKAFDEAFRAFIRETFGRDLEPIKTDDPLFTTRVGKKIQTVQCRTQGGTPYKTMAPQLEGIRQNPNDPEGKSPWVVVYSKYDLGCALDKHSTPDCLGHSHESALELAAQVVLYALKE